MIHDCVYELAVVFDFVVSLPLSSLDPFPTMKFHLTTLAALTAGIGLAAGSPASRAAQPFFYKSFDLSSLHILEEANTTYKDTARHNLTRPAEDILGDGGMNTVRLR